MSKEKSDDLVNKYLAAESTLDDEQNLFNTINQPPGIQEWSSYVKQNKKEAPSHFNDSIWASIQTRKKRRQRTLVGLTGIAASIVLFMMILQNSTGDNNISYDEKEALLNEALSMFKHDKPIPSEQSVIYEDEMIIIYKTSK